MISGLTMLTLCSTLIGQLFITGLLIGCSVFTETRAADAETGQYGIACSSNDDCDASLQLACVNNQCACDNSDYIYDRKHKRCKKICRGSSEGLVKHGTFDHQYALLKQRYENCSFVDGNLELTSLEGDYDLSFLKDIEEVDGYVLIVNLYSAYLNLTKLHIIRGRTLFHHKGLNYSLYVALNSNPRNELQGLRELQFVSLKEIVRGEVYFYNNNLLCFLNTIRWDDINTEATPNLRITQDSNDYRRQCPACPAECYNSYTRDTHCWGSGPGMCQKLNYIKEMCSESCEAHQRCFGEGQNECCHRECAAGCTGPKNTDCITCRNFYNEGSCQPFCPQMRKYDTSTFKYVDNPDGRYAFGALCVKDCPGYLLKDSNACVLQCPEGKLPEKDTNMCIPCEGTCPKSCQGNQDQEFLHKDNLENFRGCTMVEGNIKILKVSFEGDPYHETKNLTVEDLQVLKDVKEVSGFVNIQELPMEVQSLSFLSGLETISGRQLASGNALSVLKMNIEYIGLTSLRKIRNGNVMIALNSQLCYTHNLKMDNILNSPDDQLIRIYMNRPDEECVAEGKACHSECDEHGCWGPGPAMCLQCRNMRVDHNMTCVRACSDISLHYQAEGNVCKQCDPQCADGCSGSGPHNCTSCKKVAMVGHNSTECMEKCPLPLMYPDENRTCAFCHPNCAVGCSGPSVAVKIGGCDTCELAINRTHLNGSVDCLPRDQDQCPDGYYAQQFRSVENQSVENHPLHRKLVCQPCHELCLTCHSPGHTNCPTCRYFKHREHGFSTCLKNCTSHTYPSNGECLNCHLECRNGCNGPEAYHCNSCYNYKVMLENNTEYQFECVKECPDNLRFRVDDPEQDNSPKSVCANEQHPEIQRLKEKNEDDERKRLLTIILPSVAGVVILGILLTVFGYHWRQRERAKENTIKLTAQMTGAINEEPLTPTDAKPDLSKLRLIPESQLRRGGIIGSGAFGTVYKGFWIPEGENVKIPVAIKVLQEGTSANQNQELLAEARVMASVEHPCCIRILAVCMASEMMLITQLMPLGCLLDYIKKHKENTGSKSLLNWCTQIARGMAYLEERGIVHRDLAARNVLVQSAGQVKITDFGLAKLLDYNEDEYHAAGGKMPIKWLALECIQHRIFTHKSDVWSYGVTAWELFTYGNRPYDSVRARDVPDLLEKGERLPQPPICTIDVYMIMIKCWMLDADSRPSFHELAEEFAKMARDPGRYLVIQGDKLMRLPSYSYDKDDLVRQLSMNVDGPEEVIEADDYLQPAPPTPLHADNNNVKVPLLSGDPSSPGAKGKGPRLIREKRYGHLESAAAARHQRELSPGRSRDNSISGRYCTDPVTYRRGADNVDGISFPPTSPSPSNLGSNYFDQSDIPIQLALDEDDYLQPKSSNPKAYLDLIGNKDTYQNEKELFSKDQDNYWMPSSGTPIPTFENPEYFDDNPVFTPNNNQELEQKPSVKPKIAPKPRRLTNEFYDVNGRGSRSPPGFEKKPLLSNCSNTDSAV
uniref:receptor protein-tyrosine kinase n=1 Tax=Sinonovacula constricta TaxID=98310 RepID=A0A3G1S231_SINCO|nr:epidermal growth factor receptor 1b [Sinonovacula constricta]